MLRSVSNYENRNQNYYERPFYIYLGKNEEINQYQVSTHVQPEYLSHIAESNAN